MKGLAALVAVAAVALAGCGIENNRRPNSGAADDNSFYRAHNFDTALNAVKGEVGTGGDILDIRVEAKRTSFTVREGKTESATGYSALATDAGDLSSFDVDVVGQGSLGNQAIPASDVIASALARMEAQARKRDPEATLGAIQFFTLSYDPTSQRAEWDMNVHGRLYIANLDGTNFHSPGEGAGTLTNPELNPTERNALRLSHCISQAGGDPAKIQRCQREFAQ
jgi:alpha-D-ribose 1-methylphosphonate 5-triphosphate synthase subunit PhnG